MTELTIYDPVQKALKAASEGFPVFPACPKTKKPLVDRWPERATRDPAQIRRDFAPFPNAMVAVCTGKPSGRFVIDVDVAEGECPFERLAKFEGGREPIKGEMRVLTASGGLHEYCSMPENGDVRNSAGKLAYKIDVRGTGGYVIYPGSRREDGRFYTMIERKI